MLLYFRKKTRKREEFRKKLIESGLLEGATLTEFYFVKKDKYSFWIANGFTHFEDRQDLDDILKGIKTYPFLEYLEEWQRGVVWEEVQKIIKIHKEDLKKNFLSKNKLD